MRARFQGKGERIFYCDDVRCVVAFIFMCEEIVKR